MNKNNKILITETFLFRPTLMESDGNNKIIARGQFGKADIPTANRRVYPKSLWERELSTLKPRMQDNQIYGELDHPGDGQTKLQRVSHLITNAEITDDGLIIGEAVILPDTRNGKQLLAILKNGGKVGVSSRGFGSIQTDTDGNDIVQDDFQLMTWDFVADPAAAGSYPEFTQENKKTPNIEIKISEDGMKTNNKGVVKTEAIRMKEQDIAVDDKEKDEQENPNGNAVTVGGEEEKYQEQELDKEKNIEQEEPSKDDSEDTINKMEATISKIRKEESEKAVAKLSEMIEGLREKLIEDVRSELSSDPKIAGAKIALENVKKELRPYILGEDISEEINNRDSRIEDLQKEVSIHKEQLGEYANVTKELGYKLRVEQVLNDKDFNIGQKKEVRQRMGDVTRFESLNQLDVKLKEVLSTIKEQNDRHGNEMAQKSQQIAQLESKIKVLEDGYKNAIKVAESFGIKAYMEKKLAGNPYSTRIKKIVENRGLTNVNEVDALIEQFQSMKTKGNDLRKKIQSSFKFQGRETLVEDQVEMTFPKNKRSEELIEGTGITMDDAVEMSKLGEDLK